MIYKLTSINTIITKIVRDLGLGNQDIPYQDYIEWIAEALKQIGAYNQFEEKEDTIDIHNYSGELPCDFYKLVRLRSGCNKATQSSNPFTDDTYQNMLDKSCTGTVDYTKLSPSEWEALSNPAEPRMLTDYKDDTTSVQLNKHLFGNVAANSLSESDYNIQANKVIVGFQEGVMTIQYIRIAVDEDGFPMVPDDVGYDTALFWYCAYHISMRNPQLLPNQRMRDMEYCRQMWNKYCGQARAYSNMPDIHQIENLKNTLWRTIRDKSASITDYTDIGFKQTLDLDGIR